MKIANFKTPSQKKSQIDRNWHLLDAGQTTLGRLASVAASLLIGKHKPTYTPHIEAGDMVIIINAQDIKVSGKKEDQKKYYRHSGFIGNLKTSTFAREKDQDPKKVIYAAVKGMLPKNKLQQMRLNHLKIYLDGQHPHAPQKPRVYKLTAGKK